MNSFATFAVKTGIVMGFLASVGGIYSAVKDYNEPKAKLDLYVDTTDFLMPPVLDSAFNQLPEKAELAHPYEYVAENSALNKQSYAVLMNTGGKMATDIKISFPNAHIIRIREGKNEPRIIEGNTDVAIEKLLPDANVVISAWGVENASNKDSETISGVYSEGRINTRNSDLVYPSDSWIIDKFAVWFSLCFAIVGVALLYGIYEFVYSRWYLSRR